MKIIEETDRYDIVQWEFQGIPITFRFWKDGCKIVEIRVDEHFAKANGYKSVDDMWKTLLGKLSLKSCLAVCLNGSERALTEISHL